MARYKSQSTTDMPALRKIRERLGLTQSELAKLIPDKTRTKTITQKVISNWELGVDEPELTIIQTKALCKALGVKLEDLPDDFGPPNKYHDQQREQKP